MSMLCSLYRITENETKSVLEVPDAVHDLLGNTPLPAKVGFFSRLFGKSKTNPPESSNKLQPVSESDIFELDQAWHILHYLYSGCDAEGEWPLAFIMSGGQEVGEDLGYGPARLFQANDLKEIAAFLSKQTRQSLNQAYDTEGIKNARIYWQAASDSDERQSQIDELWSMTQGMREFLDVTLQEKKSILIQIY